MIDRVCMGRCFSYANYEPSTAQFRIRAEVGNPYVASNYQESWEMQAGLYVVKRRDLPIYKVDVDRDGRLFMKELKAGARTGNTSSKIVETLFPIS